MDSRCQQKTTKTLRQRKIMRLQGMILWGNSNKNTYPHETGSRLSPFTTSPGPTRRASITSLSPTRSITAGFPMAGTDSEDMSITAGSVSSSHHVSSGWAPRVPNVSQSSSKLRRSAGGGAELSMARAAGRVSMQVGRQWYLQNM